MAVTLDNFAVGTLLGGGPASPYTFNITLGSGNKGIIVRILRFSPGGVTIDSVTIGSDSLSLLAGSSVGLNDYFVETWSGLTSLSGSQTVTVNYTGTGSTFLADCVSATGIDLTTPVNNGNAAAAGAAPLALPMTSDAGDLTSTAFQADGTSARNSDQTTLWTNNVVFALAGDVGPGTANPTHTWPPGSFDGNVLVTGSNFKQAGSQSVDTLAPAFLQLGISDMAGRQYI